MMEQEKITPAPALADVNMLKQQLVASRKNRLENAVYEAIKANADIKDSRVKFF